MKKKVIPFPAPLPAAVPSAMVAPSRILVHVGKQRIALDLSCHASVLNPAPPALRALPVSLEERKKRKAQRSRT